MELIRQALAREPAQLDVPVRTVSELYSHVIAVACEQGLVAEEHCGELVAELLAREASAPCTIGGGVAVPHVYLESLDRAGVLFFRLKHPVQMDALDGSATRYVFLLIGPSRTGVDHLQSLANIARLMSDSGFRYDLERAQSADELVEALAHFERRQRVGVSVPPAKDALARTGRLFGGVLRDVRCRAPHYWSDFTDGLHPKTLSAIGFMLFACLAPAVTFGGVMAARTNGAIGAAEMLAATAACGVVFSLTAGQPLVILGGTGPLLVFTAILYTQCEVWGLPFLPVYAWVGLWSAVILAILAATDASAWMRWFTRFTDEIFAALISLIFIFEALTALHATFADEAVGHDSALLTLVLALGTLYLGHTLGRFRDSRYLSGRVRELIADFGPTLALALMTLVALGLHEVSLARLQAPDSFGTTAGRPWIASLLDVSWGVRLGAIGPALLVAVLVYLDQNITARIVNAPDHRLRKGEGYHLDLLVVAVLLAVCSVFGLPWLVAATVRSLNHLHSLGTERDGRIVHVRETRVAALVVHGLIGLSLLALPMLKLVPMAVLYGLFLMMGVNSMHGNQFLDRVKLWFTDPNRYPAHRYLSRVSLKKIHLFTVIQSVCLAVLWAVKVSVLGILFPLFIAALVPLRLWIARWFSRGELAELDAESATTEADGEPPSLTPMPTAGGGRPQETT